MHQRGMQLNLSYNSSAAQRSIGAPAPFQLQRCASAHRPAVRRRAQRSQRRSHVHAAFRTPPQQEQGLPADRNAAPSARKLGRFSPKRDIRQAMLNFRYEVEVDAGTLAIRPLSAERLREATDLLTDVFAATDDRIGLYSKYMRREIRVYLERHLKLAPDAIVLLGILRPKAKAAEAVAEAAVAAQPMEAAEAAAAPLEADGGGNGAPRSDCSGDGAEAAAASAADGSSRALDDAGVLIGTVEMAFTEATRTRFLTLNPPQGTAYLGNMCTGPAFRRRGYGMLLLKAAEELTRVAAYPEIYLHLRFKDKDAAAMYQRAGYAEVKRDNFCRALLGLDRRFLMRKAMGQSEDGDGSGSGNGSGGGVLGDVVQAA